MNGSTARGQFAFEPVWQPTICPWKIADGTKILAMTGPVSQYRYGRYNGPEDGWQQDWQQGLVCSPQADTYVIDVDDPSKLPDDFPFPKTGAVVASGRDGGYHIWVDARGVPEHEFPRQRNYPWGDVKANGFTPMPGTRHPSGRRYEWVNRAEPVRHDPAWQQWLERTWKGLERARQDGTSPSPCRPQDAGGGRNAHLMRVKAACAHRGLTEDEANQRVGEANEDFAVPLSARELRPTVLRHKPSLFDDHGGSKFRRSAPCADQWKILLLRRGRRKPTTWQNAGSARSA